MRHFNERRTTTVTRQEVGAGDAGSCPAGTDDNDALTDSVRLRVRYDESDQMGITYHARYLDWFVIGRTELLRSLGLPYARLEHSGLLLPVLEVNCRYFASTRYDDIVEVRTTLTQLTRTRVAFRYAVYLVADETATEAEDQLTIVTSGETKHAFVGSDHRPVDVRRRYPDVWQRLSPLADLLASAK